MHYLSHLARDRRLKKLIEAQDAVKLSKRKNICTYLCASIMSQQLSTKVANVIHLRFLNLYNGKEPAPQEILNTPLDKLRSIGLSNAKTRYVHNVAKFAVEQGMELKKLDKMTNEEVIEYLTTIKGVGRWTAEMLLMFALGREDVFAIDDLGIQNAMIKLYKLDRSDKKKLKEELIRISGKWSPYRTYACAHLWQWKDNVPVKQVKSPGE
jgi:DNA-3-methyladenine glycosylase II